MMSFSALERLDRYKKLVSLRNVVLLNNRAYDSSVKSLEVKIQERVTKEFLDPTSDEQEIIEEMKATNLKFVDKLSKQQNDREVFFQVLENVREKDVHFFHKFSDPNIDLAELLVAGDALKRGGVNSVTLYLPYIAYQRQDKKDDGRVPIAARWIYDVISISFGNHLKRIVTFDLHAKQEQGYFDGPLDELSAIPDFAAYYHDLFKDSFASDRRDVLVISPDPGGAKRARSLAKALGTQFVILDKVRTGHGEAEHRFYLPSDVKGKKAIVVDDIVDSGSTAVGEYENNKIGPLQYLRDERGAEVHFCATHALLSSKNGILAEDRMRKAGVSAVFADTMPEKYDGYYKENSDWMSIISLNYVSSKAVYCNQVGASMSDFLKKRDERLFGRLDFVVKKDKNGVLVVE